MFGLLGFILLFVLFIVIIVLSLLGNIVRMIFGLGKRTPKEFNGQKNNIMIIVPTNKHTIPVTLLQEKRKYSEMTKENMLNSRK